MRNTGAVLLVNEIRNDSKAFHDFVGVLIANGGASLTPSDGLGRTGQCNVDTVTSVYERGNTYSLGHRARRPQGGR